MAKKKAVREGYSQKQEDKLLSIPTGSGNLQKIINLAAKWGKGEAGVKSKWYALHAARKSTKKSPAVPKTAKHSVIKTYADKIAPMIFKGVEFVDPRVKVSQDEETALRKGIDLAIKDEQLTIKRAIPIAKKYELRAKAYLKEQYPENVFSFHKNEKDPKTLMLIQKS